MKKFVVIGLGRFGRTLARQLSVFGAEVLAIDMSVELVNQVAPDVALAICADANRLEQARVRAVLSGMDERQARLLLLRHTGFSYQEIAAALDLNPASIGTLLNRAEQEFRKIYESNGDV